MFGKVSLYPIYDLCHNNLNSIEFDRYHSKWGEGLRGLKLIFLGSNLKKVITFVDTSIPQNLSPGTPPPLDIYLIVL